MMWDFIYYPHFLSLSLLSIDQVTNFLIVDIGLHGTTLNKSSWFVFWLSFLYLRTEIAPIPIDCDSTTCSNAGSCIQELTGYITCICEAGWTGSNCSENIDDCREGPCSNGGNCEDELSGFTCSCPPIWTGRICEDGNFFHCILFVHFVVKLFDTQCKRGGTRRQVLG